MYSPDQLLNVHMAELSLPALFALYFFATFVSEDAACLLAGTAVANGKLSFAAALATCLLGIFVGDMLLYAAGRKFGRRIFALPFVRRFVNDRARARAETWLTHNGPKAVFASRFVTGLRLPTYLLAGALRTDCRKFTFYFLLAAAAWTPLLVGSAAFSQRFIFGRGTLLGVAILFLTLRFALKLMDQRRRRITLGKVKRFAKWEFWPLHVFYIPVVLYVLVLALRHRSLIAFTAANPAIPAGGFKGESKDEIYRMLASSPEARGHLLRHVLIKGTMPAHERVIVASRFAGGFPMIAKPDAGERGTGVQILRSLAELHECVLSLEVDVILQEFVPGLEFSVFYYRFPSETRGRIFSITEKLFPEITGDGTSTLEELILADGRAVCLAEKYFQANRGDLHRVPAAGEKVALIEIGTHSRGAVFLDGGCFWTPELEEKIDRICRGVEGFNFGRFDLRAPSIEDFRRGENIKIIELNGVTSESTNIYDPRHGLADAYRTLFAQWRLAFEIGAQNIKLGAKPTPIRTLIALALGWTETPSRTFDEASTSEQCA